MDELVSACLDDATLKGLAADELSSETAARANSHLIACRTCVARLVATATTPTQAEALSTVIDRARSEQTVTNRGERTAATTPEHGDRTVAQNGPVYAGLAAGRVIDRYFIERHLGGGGMGHVYQARHVHIGRRVALKLLHTVHELTERELERFRREAEALASIESPHVVQVYDFGIANGQPFLAMELLEGEALVERTSKGRVPLTLALDLGRQVLHGLAAAHAAGVVHRDIKPSNVFVVKTKDGREAIKLVDFGLSKLEDAKAITDRGSVMGTPLFMSPEQLEGSDAIDARSDLYSVGVMLYRMISGEYPFSGKTITALRDAMTERTPRRIETLAPDVPPHVADAVHRAISLSPDERFASADQLLAALDAPTMDAEPPKRARRVLVPILVIGSVALIASAVAFTRMSQGEPTSTIGSQPHAAPRIEPAPPPAAPTAPLEWTIVEPPVVAPPPVETIPAANDAPDASPRRTRAPIAAPPSRTSAQPRRLGPNDAPIVR